MDIGDMYYPDIENLTYIAKQVIPEVSIVEKRGCPDGTCCGFENGKPVVYWDPLMYEFFEKNMILLDTFPYEEGKDDRIIKEMYFNCLGILLDHLSNKANIDSPVISSVLRKKANDYNYPAFNSIYKEIAKVSEWNTEYFVQKLVVAWLIMYHELAHLLFQISPDEKEKWEGVVVSNCSLMRKSGNHRSFAPADKKVGKAYFRILKEICRRDSKNQALLEEVAADTFALSHVYATVHECIHVLDKATISDNIMWGYLRFVSLASQYGYIAKYWEELYPMCIVNKRRTPQDAEEILKRKSEMDSVRCGVWVFVSLVTVIQFDRSTWGYSSDKGESLEDPRLKAILQRSSINSGLFYTVFDASFSPMLMNEIILLSHRLAKDEYEGNYTYPDTLEGENQVTWFYIQYHNDCGLNSQRKGKFDEAIEEFQLATVATRQYLGCYHRLTARGYNNLCTCYLGKVLANVDRSSPSFHNNLELAYYYSSVAYDIITSIGGTNDRQAGFIYQNRGDLLLLQDEYEDALTFLLHAKTVKDKARLDEEMPYSETDANADFSIARAYSMLDKFSDAASYCERALTYYKMTRTDDDPKLHEVTSVHRLIGSKVNDKGNRPDFISLVMKDEVKDWDKFVENYNKKQ